jgi:hypothetical protein
MAFPLPLRRLCLTLAFAIGLTAAAQEVDPEPPSKTKEEAAAPAVDLEKAKTDAMLGRQAARNEAISKNNLSQLGIALHNYYATHKRLPADVTDKKGKALLSWRIALLPYLEQDKLYRQFKLDEPWDSKHNAALLEKMPDIFRSPRVKVKSKGNTVYQVFTGPNAVFGRAAPLNLTSISDGTSNTIFAVESSTAAPWTKPGGIAFDRKKAVPDLGKAYGKRPLAVMFDGAPRVLDLNKILPDTLKNAIDPADGNVLGKDWEQD